MYTLIPGFDPVQQLLLFLFPIIGWGLDRFVSMNNIRWLGIIFLLLFLPIITGYDFVWNWVYEFSLMMMLAVAWALVLSLMTKRVWKFILAVIFAISLFGILGFNAFLTAKFGGSSSISGRWNKGNYQVARTKSQGFSGRPLTSYELYHRPFFGLYRKKIGNRADHPGFPIEGCLVAFEATNITFDQCKKEISIK